MTRLDWIIIVQIVLLTIGVIILTWLSIAQIRGWNDKDDKHT